MASAWHPGQAGHPSPLRASAEARRDGTGLDGLQPQKLNPPASGSRGATIDDLRVNPPAASSVGASVGESRRDLATHILNLRLRNPHNICYMNSSFHAVVWSLHCAALPLTQSLLQILRGSKANLLQALSLQLMGWARPTEQHDACEFCSYFISGLGLHNAFARWQGIVHEGARAHVHDKARQFRCPTLGMLLILPHSSILPMPGAIKRMSIACFRLLFPISSFRAFRCGAMALSPSIAFAWLCVSALTSVSHCHAKLGTR